ncbi:hypothetical protein KUCAC02_006289, partial [Chaenocephalus aceratus]
SWSVLEYHGLSLVVLVGVIEASGRGGDKLSGHFGLPGGFLVVLDFPRVTLDNVAVRVMMRRPTDQEKFEGWLSGQTCDLRGEIGFGSCLLALAEGGDKL